MDRDERGFAEGIVGDGRSLISLTALCLALSGTFAILESATGELLPHDVAFLRMSRQDLCSINECRIVHFMIHDRVSFGGSLIAIAALYLWLAEFPLRAGQTWAWWTLVGSGIVGFGSFLTYLGYGYLDTWHGVATLLLLPCFLAGLWLSRRIVHQTSSESGQSSRLLLAPSPEPAWSSPEGIGRVFLLFAAAAMIVAGFTIQIIGMTSVFVPTDLTFMGMTRAHLDAINPRLVPLIAHDRAGFGGGVATAGLLTACSVWWGTPSRSLWQALMSGGIVGWGTAIGVHPIIGYTDAIHLLPAIAAAALYFGGLALIRPAMFTNSGRP